MISAIRQAIDRFRGFGDHALSIPSLDGAFRPNEILENAKVCVALKSPDNIVQANGQIYLSSGGDLFKLTGDQLETVETGSAPITAMAGAPDGRLAVARSGGSIIILDTDKKDRHIDALNTHGDVTALCFLPEGDIAATIGAAGTKASDWRQDVMSRGHSGSVWRLSEGGAAQMIADGLAYPNGVAPHGQDGLIVSLAWETALVSISDGNRPVYVLQNLPGYPSRIVAAHDGGYWLSIFAPLNQLVEFVLRENKYRKRMMAELAPEYWICPSLTPASSPLEVMQDGAQKIGGSIKPWAPSLSYGLVVRIDENLLPQYSYHSRSNGQRHGITSLVDTDKALLVTTHGGAAVLNLAHKELK